MRMLSEFAVGLAIASAFVAGPVSAAPVVSFSDQDRADANCVAVIAVALGNLMPANARNVDEVMGATSALTYFLGKLKGTLSDA